MRRWAVGLAVTGLVVAGACSGGGDDRVTGPTVPTDTRQATTTSTSTTVAPASYDVPEVIDQAYVQRVVSAYDKVLGDAIRVLKRDGGVSDEFLKHLLAIYTAEEFEFQQQAWAELVAGGRLDRTPGEPGDPTTRVERLAGVSADCVVARAERDHSANLTVAAAESPQDDYIVLVRKKPDRDPLALNPTPWVMGFDGYKQDGSVPAASCGG